MKKFHFKGIKERYPKIPTNEKLRGFIQLIRPFTTFAAFLAGIFLTYGFSMFTNTDIPIWLPYSVGFFLALLQASGQIFNQSIKEEVEIDKINGKNYRPTVSGLISLRQGKIFSMVLLGIAIIGSFYIDIMFGIIAVVIGFFAIFYTAPPIRMKKRFLANNIHQGIARGFLPPLYVSMLFGAPDFAFWYGLAIAFWIMGFQSTKDFDDIEGDKKFKIKTLPVVIGKKATVGFMIICNIVSAMMLGIGYKLIAIPSEGFWILMLVPIGLGFLTIQILKNDVKMKKLENSKSWIMFYITIMVWYLMPFLILSSNLLL